MSAAATELLEQLLGLWTAPSEDDATMLRRFGELYTDPVVINGTPTPLTDLLARARLLSAGLADVSREVIDVVEAPSQVAFAFRLRGRHVGPLPTPLGPVPATGQPFDILGIDILQLDEDGRIRSISVLSGLMDVLASAGAVRLA
jgi:hypothetical protein